MDTDSRIAFAAAALYLVLALALLPTAEYFRAFGGGVAVFAAVVAGAGCLGRGRLSGASVFAVAFGSSLVLAIPTFPAMGGTHPAAIPLGFLGVQATVLLWAARRWRPQRPAPTPMPLRAALSIGAWVALGLSVIATVPVLVASRSGGRNTPALPFVYAGYFAGMLAAATVYWALQRIAHLAVGRYLIGVVGGTCVYGAMAPVAMLVDGKPMAVGEMIVIAVVAGGLVGPAVALGAKPSTRAA